MNTIKFYTLGCKVNQYETQQMRERFLGRGFKEVFGGERADTYVINTCTVTHKADSESLNLLRRAERESPSAKIIVTGCLAELDWDKIKKTARGCLIVKNRDKKNISSAGISYFAGRSRAFLKIQDGCDNFCSYCKVPLVRGKSKSKPLGDIIKEAERLVQNDYKEIVLTGICLGFYGRELKPKKSLVGVIKGLEKITGLLRIRLSSIEPQDITDGLIKKIANSAKLCRHLHIPLQSGDDAILKKMNRKYTSAEYLNLIKKIKRRIPGITITTDVLVGFPGETEENFNNTRKLLAKIKPLKAHIFPYSKREGTLSARFKDEIPPQVIKRRVAVLKAFADACALKCIKQSLNKARDVLIEGPSKKGPFLWEGYTDNYIKVCLKSRKNLTNRLVDTNSHE
ncbi:MAG: MiaB/RimO family radical SAM methylthiotransferase [Candidatus Omnitrophota bacterium]